MSKRGPPPTPTQVLRLRGSLRGKYRKPEPEPTSSVPTCPTWLSAYAKTEWKRITRELKKIGILTQVDRAVLAGYCQSWSDYMEATKLLRNEGGVLTTAQGTPVRNPLANIQGDARTSMLRFAQELGLSPAARARLATEKPKSADDPLSELMKARPA